MLNNAREYILYLRLTVCAVIALSFCGCQDKAKEHYAKCVQLDVQGDIPGAWDACNASITADPTSKNGKAAATKLTEMRSRYEYWKREQEKKAAKEITGRAKTARAYDGRPLGVYLEEAARSSVEETNLALGSTVSKLVNSWDAVPLDGDKWTVTYIGHIGSDFDGRAIQSEYVFEFNPADGSMAPVNAPAKEALNGPPQQLKAPSKKRK